MRLSPEVEVQIYTKRSFRWLPVYQSQDWIRIQIVPLQEPPPSWSFSTSVDDAWDAGASPGYIDMVTGVGQVWEMETVEARKGYGPLLYDLALELATASAPPATGSPLASRAAAISPLARTSATRTSSAPWLVL